MIKELKELVEYIDQSPSSFMQKRKRELHPKLEQFFDIVASYEGDVADDEVSMALYSKPAHGAYYNLRKRLYNELLLMVELQYQTSENKRQTYTEIRDFCISQSASARLMQTKGLFANVIYICKNILKIALAKEFHDVAIDLLKVILSHYGSVDRNMKKYDHFKTIYDRVSLLRIEEDDLQLKYYGILSKLSKIENDLSSENLDEAFEVESCRRLIQENRSFKLSFYSYNLLCLNYLLRNDFQNLEKIADSAFHFTLDHPFRIDRLTLRFLQRRLTAEIKLNRRLAILNTFAEMEKHLEQRSRAFYVVGIYKSLLLIHDQKFGEAQAIISDLIQTKYFKSLPVSISEYISLLRGYLVFLARAEIYETEEVDTRFRINKFVNDIPLYQKDKRGTHIAILVLHVLFLLLNRKEGDIIDRVDALRLYSYRYLRKDKTFRSNCFIKMLIEMTKADFNPIRTERYTKDLRERLGQHPLELSEQPLEVEIVPYEELWEVVMHLLERNSTKGRRRSSLA